MTRITRQLDSLEATAAFGRDLAGVLRAGDAVLLDGPLGAGKTTLVRTVAVALGVDPSMVSSPTFVIAQEYPAHPADVVHIDAYRLTGGAPDELDALGWDRLVGPQAGTIALIEWGVRLAGHLEGDRVASITIQPTGETSRHITLDIPDTWSQRTGFDALADEQNRTEQREDTVCRVTGLRVPADSPTWPFADERARMSDLYHWFSGAYQVTRPIEQADLEQGE